MRPHAIHPSAVLVAVAVLLLGAPATASSRPSEARQGQDARHPAGAVERFAASDRGRDDLVDLIEATTASSTEADGKLINTYLGVDAAPDLNGDGTPDAVEARATGITAIDGATGGVLWFRPGYPLLLASVGPIDDVPGEDLVIWPYEPAPPTQPVRLGSLRALSGRTGADIWRRELTEETGSTLYTPFTVPVNAPVDLDGDGTADLVLGQYTFYNDRVLASTHYAISGRTGATLARYGAGVGVPVDRLERPYAFVVPDLSGDGLPDVVTTVAHGKVTAVVAFAGATGTRRWDASFYSPGDDVLTHGFGGRLVSGGPSDVGLVFGLEFGAELQVWGLDGRDGTPTWDRTVPGMAAFAAVKVVPRSSSTDGILFSAYLPDLSGATLELIGAGGSLAWEQQLTDVARLAGDVTGDGVEDLIALDYRTRVARIVSGADGTDVWSRTLGDFESLEPVAADLDGDGRDDLIYKTTVAQPITEYIALSGADGSALWPASHRSTRTSVISEQLRPIDVRDAPGVDLIESFETEDHPGAYALRPGDGGPALWTRTRP